MAQVLYEFGPYLLDASQLLLRRDGTLVPLPPKVLETLRALVVERGELVTKQQLMETVWPDTFVEEGNLTQNVSQLRRVLGKTPGGEEYIRTLPKRGYRIGVPVLEVPGRKPDATLAQTEVSTTESALAQTTAARPATTVARKWLWVVVATAAVLLLAVGLAALRLKPPLPRVSGYTQLTHDGLLKTGFVTQAAGPVGSLITDGARVYFNEGSPASVPTLAQVSATGGETSVIPNSLGIPQLLDISPDRSALLVTDYGTGASEGSLWSVPLPSGSPHPLPGQTAWDASFSPDDREMIYVHGQDLYRAHSDGTEARKLVHLSGAGWRPRWSPDGTIIRITLVDTKTALQSLWEVNADGSGLHPLLPGWNAPPSECCGNWTPDGQYFVFQATRDEKTEVWAIRDQRSLFAFKTPTPSVPFQLTSGQLSSLSPVISPDGRKLFVIGRQLRGEVERWDNRSQQWVQTLGGISAEFAEYSPDRQWITYVAFPDDSLWKSRIDGSERTQLTFAPLHVHEPHWSPAGKLIAFQGYGHGTPGRMYSISADGGQPQPLTGAEHHELAPSWSPDGKSVAFSYAPFIERSPETLGIFILDLATRAKHKIPGSDAFLAPVWSPDSRYLSATSIQTQQIGLFDFQTQTWTELAPGFGITRWSRDGAFLYYLKYGKDAAVMHIRLSDRKIERVAPLSGTRQAGAMAGLVFGLTPDGAPMILRDTGTEELYSLDWQTK